MDKIYESLQFIRQELFDADLKTKFAFNSVIEYFAYGKSGKTVYTHGQMPKTGKHVPAKSYVSDSYGSDSYEEQEDPRLSAFFAYEKEFLKLTEPQMYSLYAAIQNKEYIPTDVSKTIVLMALQAAAEGANTHRLVERIESSTGSYWPYWLTQTRPGNFHGKSSFQLRNIPDMRNEYKNSKYKVDQNYHKFLNNPPMDMMATDYPKDYGGKGYQSDSYGSQSY